ECHIVLSLQIRRATTIHSQNEESRCRLPPDLVSHYRQHSDQMCRHHLYLELVRWRRLLPKSAPTRKRMAGSMTKMMASS
ncbi:hypothetical protein LINPERPRIM_LOCUS251, partial [Linum perenne]